MAAMSPLNLKLLTLYGSVFNGAVDSVTAPTTTGNITVLPSHARLLTQLDNGDLEVRTGGESTHFAVAGGFLEVDSDEVTVFADAAERDSSIDLERAEQALARAQERIKGLKSDLERERAIKALYRARIRVKLARRRRSTRPARSAAEGGPPA